MKAGKTLEEILPGLFHWTRKHPRIGIEVSSYWLAEERTLIDPLVPDEGMEVFSEAPPELILLTNRHHYRDSGRLTERFGCTVQCVEQGLHEFTKGEKVGGFRFGETFAGGITSIEIGAICPDETAFRIPRVRALAVADGVVRDGDGPLSFVPDEYIGDDPASVKAGIKRAYSRVLDLDFDNLLLAHGLPWIGGAKGALRTFVSL